MLGRPDTVATSFPEALMPSCCAPADWPSSSGWGGRTQHADKLGGAVRANMPVRVQQVAHGRMEDGGRAVEAQEGESCRADGRCRCA